MLHNVFFFETIIFLDIFFKLLKNVLMKILNKYKILALWYTLELKIFCLEKKVLFLKRNMNLYTFYIRNKGSSSFREVKRKRTFLKVRNWQTAEDNSIFLVSVHICLLFSHQNEIKERRRVEKQHKQCMLVIIPLFWPILVERVIKSKPTLL